MDYLDPKKIRSHRIRLFIGYGLVAIAIALLLIILLFQAYGYNYHKGEVVRDGLAFFSSCPNDAEMFVDGKHDGSTSQRLQLQAGKYHIVMHRKGYYDWERTVTIRGGQVEHFDYPFLFPKKLKTTTQDSYTKEPTLASESLDSSLLLLQTPNSLASFNLYNLTSPSKIVPKAISLLSDVLTPYNGKQSLAVVQWSNDDRHVLLKHTYGKHYEYVLLDTTSPSKSLNLNAALGTSPTKLSLMDGDYNHYFVYNKANKVLSTASLGNQKLISLIKNIGDYTTYNGNEVLYVQASEDNDNSSQVMLYKGGKSYPIKRVKSGDKYLLDIDQYGGDLYVVVSARSENKVEIYKNPLSVLGSHPNKPLLPTDILKIADPIYEKFSPDAQYIAVENGQYFAVYDIAFDKNYVYKAPDKLSSPQQHANWMREGQLDYVSGGRLVAFDFDGTNLHHLMPASPSYQPFFDINYRYAYTLAPNTDKSSKAAILLTQTALLTKADL